MVDVVCEQMQGQKGFFGFRKPDRTALKGLPTTLSSRTTPQAALPSVLPGPSLPLHSLGTPVVVSRADRGESLMVGPEVFEVTTLLYETGPGI